MTTRPAPDTEGDGETAKPPSPDKKKAGVRFMRLGEGTGVTQFRMGRWGTVAADVVNTSEEPREVLARFNFPDDVGLQYARQIWSPPRSVRRTWSPIRLPNQKYTDNRVPLLGMLVDRSSGTDVSLRRSEERIENTVFIRIVDDPTVTAIIIDEGELSRIEETGEINEPYECAIALRTKAGLNRRVAVISDRYLPALPQALDAVDQMIVYNDRFAEDVAGAAAIRAWLNNGGRLWVMLDRVGELGLERLLGDVFTCEVLDRVELNEIEIQTIRPKAALQYMPKRTLETPVSMVRVVADGLQPLHMVNGWPASLTAPVGRGRVIITTLGAMGWVERRHGVRRGRWNPNTMTDFMASSQLAELPVFEARVDPPLQPAEFEEYLTEQIGYSIAGRNLVFIILASFCGVLLIAGALLKRIGRLERLGFIAPLAAVTASLLLVAMGMRSQQAVPSTLAQGQLIEVGDVPDRANVSGMFAVYQPEVRTASIGADQGGVFEPDFTGLTSSTRRMTWTDLNRWRWENIELPIGIRMAAFQKTVRLERPLTARGTFTEKGFEGRLEGAEGVADGLIAVPRQSSLAIRFEGDRFVAGPGDVLADGQFFNDNILSDEQRRRKLIYAQALGKRTAFPSRPTLMAWIEPLDLKFDLPGVEQAVGGGLISVPLTLERPAAGSAFVAPSPFVSFRSVKGPDGAGGSSLFDGRTGEWVEMREESRTWLRFQMPAELLPVELSKVQLQLQISAPSRRVKIVGDGAGKVVSLDERANPIGPWNIDIDDRQVLNLDEDGGLRLGVHVSPVEGDGDNKSQINWRITHLRLQAEGKTKD